MLKCDKKEEALNNQKYPDTRMWMLNISLQSHGI